MALLSESYIGAPETSERALQTVLFPLPIPPVMATRFIALLLDMKVEKLPLFENDERHPAHRHYFEIGVAHRENVLQRGGRNFVCVRHPIDSE